MQTAAMKFVARRSYRVATRRKSLSRQNMRSMALRLRYSTGEKQGFQRLWDLAGILGSVVLVSIR